LLPTKLINPTIFTAVSLISGWSAQSAFVAVELSVPVGFATSACRRENWELRGSLGELIKGRIHGQVPKPPSIDDEELYKDESHPNSPGSENKPQMKPFRMFPLLLVSAISLQCLRRHRTHSSRHCSKFTPQYFPTLSGSFVWLPQMLF